MKSFGTFLTEARKYPGLNVKKGPVEVLKAHEKDKMAFATYIDDTAEFDKLSKEDTASVILNTKSKFNTPNGIYTYPVPVLYKQYLERDKKIFDPPFAGDRKFIGLILRKSEGRHLDLGNYSDAKFEKDKKLLAQDVVGFMKKKHGIKNERLLHEMVKAMYKYAEENASNKNNGGKIWNITRMVGFLFSDKYSATWQMLTAMFKKNDADEIAKSLSDDSEIKFELEDGNDYDSKFDNEKKKEKKEEKKVVDEYISNLKEDSDLKMDPNNTKAYHIFREANGIKTYKPDTNVWAKVLRRGVEGNKKFYYDSVYDNKQQGIIHPSEPVQAVFFSRLGYEVKDAHFNKDYKMSDKDEYLSQISIIQSHFKRGKSVKSLDKDKLNLDSDSGLYLVLKDALLKKINGIPFIEKGYLKDKLPPIVAREILEADLNYYKYLKDVDESVMASAIQRNISPLEVERFLNKYDIQLSDAVQRMIVKKNYIMIKAFLDLNPSADLLLYAIKKDPSMLSMFLETESDGSEEYRKIPEEVQKEIPDILKVYLKEKGHRPASKTRLVKYVLDYIHHKTINEKHADEIAEVIKYWSPHGYLDKHVDDVLDNLNKKDTLSKSNLKHIADSVEHLFVSGHLPSYKDVTPFSQQDIHRREMDDYKFKIASKLVYHLENKKLKGADIDRIKKALNKYRNEHKNDSEFMMHTWSWKKILES